MLSPNEDMKDFKTVSGLVVPPVGLGTFPLQGRTMANVIIEAARIGYKMIDTSDDYRGEHGIGLAISELYDKTGLKREDIFLQTKVSQDNSYQDDPQDGMWFNPNSPFQQRHSAGEVVRDKVITSLKAMKTDYLDSVLVHYPYPYFYEDIWEELILLQKEGVIRYIGVSNFSPHHIDVIKHKALPFFNEMYFSPFCTRDDIVSYSEKENIQLITYSPLMGALAEIPAAVMTPLMDKYNKSKSQILLRWHLERNCIPLPKSKSVSRLKENFDVFDFSLSQNEIETLSSLNVNRNFLPESRFCPGL